LKVTASESSGKGTVLTVKGFHLSCGVKVIIKENISGNSTLINKIFHENTKNYIN